MSLKFFSILVLIFFIGCSTTPVKFDKPVKSSDYKDYYQLKDEKDNLISKKTFPQKVKDVFKRKPKVEVTKLQPSETNNIEIKKSRPLVPTRRVRKTNTDHVTNEPAGLLPNTRSEPLKAERDTGKTIMLYIVYLQAIIIIIFAYVILRQRNKPKSPKPPTTHPTTLNL
tara:strand:- start:885 stop:1391 length:507 start_codon:yes stop_codon:yes gene_type:complete